MRHHSPGQSPNKDSETGYIKFLGTAGARHVVSKQLRASGGTFLCLQAANLLLDPGPGTLVRMTSSKPALDPGKLDAIILTHRHIDHSTDVNIMVEAMTEGGFKKRGLLFAPEDCLEGEDPVILRYLRGFVEQIVVLKPDSEYSIGSVHFSTSGRHRHPVETYGIIFQGPAQRISFLVDTQYFAQLGEWYAHPIAVSW